MASLLNMSGRGLITPPPYDYEVEYLRVPLANNAPTNSAYIDLGIKPFWGLGFNIKTYGNGKYGASDGCNWAVIGTIDVPLTATDYTFVKFFGSNGWVTGFSNSPLNEGMFFEYNIKFTSETSVSASVKRNNSTVNKEITVTNTGFNTTKNVLLGYGGGLNSVADRRSGGMCIYYAKIYNFSSLIMDLIPVVKDGVGYMYDKISKRLFGNAGSGSFIIGPNVYGHYDCEVEYLEATGTQYIDTGFKATGGCIFDFEAMWTDYGGMIVGSHNPSSNSSNGFNRNMAYINAQNTVHFNKCDNYESFSYPCSTGIKYHVYYNSIGSNRIGSIDGNVIVNQTNTATLNPVNNVVFFLSQYNSTYKKGRIYNCKLYDSTSTLVRDFIPVRLGSVGYLYDKVSGKLFGNNGTGNFVLGPDK